MAPWYQSGKIVAVLCALALAGCWSASDEEVVVYSALDREFSQPILEDFERATGIRVLDKYDVESTKTVGLVSEILQEQNRPVCDVFWNNEILHTLRLQKLGLLLACDVPGAADFPASYRSPQGDWYGLAARARVLIVNTDIVRREDWPTSIDDLIDPKWKDRSGIAKPLFGTTATHAAVLFSVWGEDRAAAYFRIIRGNARVMSGNKQVASSVGRGQLAFGLTDTDDAIIEKEQGMPVAIVFPDQGERQLGTLFIPNTVCVIRGGRNPQHAQRLVNHLLAVQTEEQLARGRSAQFPLNRRVQERSRALPDEPVRWMEIDFAAAAECWPKAAALLRDEFASAD